ncbi:MAG: hypothetical protein HZC25_01895 [Rhodospirillales bacterium]|nr:hypothetical protein [Rhodospirillales bacterium]
MANTPLLRPELGVVRSVCLFPLSRFGLALMLAIGLVCAAGEAVAKVKRVKREPIGPGDYEAYRSEKLSDEDIRLLEYGRPMKDFPSRDWFMQGCREDIYGTWYEISGLKFWSCPGAWCRGVGVLAHSSRPPDPTRWPRITAAGWA